MREIKYERFTNSLHMYIYVTNHLNISHCTQQFYIIDITNMLQSYKLGCLIKPLPFIIENSRIENPLHITLVYPALIPHPA